MTPNTKRVHAGNLDNLPPGAVRRADSIHNVAIFNAKGSVYAIDDVCTHEFATLSEGDFDDVSVECPFHAARFDVRTGEPLCLPATEPLRTYTVEVVDGEIFVLIDGANS